MIVKNVSTTILTVLLAPRSLKLKAGYGGFAGGDDLVAFRVVVSGLVLKWETDDGVELMLMGLGWKRASARVRIMLGKMSRLCPRCQCRATFDVIFCFPWILKPEFFTFMLLMFEVLYANSMPETNYADAKTRFARTGAFILPLTLV